MKTLIRSSWGAALALAVALGPACAAEKQEVAPVVNAAYLPAVLGMIDRARKSVDFIELEWQYRPDVKKVQDALRAAMGRGVRVRGILDDRIRFNPRSAEFLNDYGAKVKLDSPDKMTHAKIFMADGAEVLLGSTNMTQNSIERNNETNVLIRDSAVARYFEEYFERLWKDTAREPGLEPLTSGGITAFTNRSYLNEVLPLFKGAKRSISVLMYGVSISRTKPESPTTQLADALAAAAERGIKVRLLLDKSDYNDAINAVNERARNYLEPKKVEVRYDDEKVTSHAKLLIVDDAVVIGSYNWGYDAMAKRNECAVIVRDKTAADFFTRYFETLWAGKPWGGAPPAVSPAASPPAATPAPAPATTPKG